MKGLVSLRPFPYPYLAGLALSSDIDLCDPATFLAVHRRLNLDLGLPVADSFFGRGAGPEQLAYYLPDHVTLHPQAGLIDQALAGGLIDTLHSWGDYNQAGPEPLALRRLAERVAARLVKRGLKVPLWVNHGDSFDRHNVHFRLQPGWRGDDPTAPVYTADLFPALGIRFVCRGDLVRWPLSGRLGPLHPTLLARRLSGLARNLAKLLLGRRAATRPPAELLELARPDRLADGRPVVSFIRFFDHPGDLWAAATRETLRYCLAPAALTRLTAEGGYAVVFTHLGRPPEEKVDLFPPPDWAALEDLAGRFHDGRIWVAATGRLLTYWLVTRRLSWRAEEENGRLVIDLAALADPITGPRIPEPAELAGLTFYTPRPEATVLRLAGRDLPALVHPPDVTGQGSVGLAPPPPPATDLLRG